MKNESGERILLLEGEIAPDTWWNDAVTPQQFREELNSCDGDVLVKINSEGGDVFAATQIYNMLKEYDRGQVTIRIDSLAASAASIVAMAGDVIEISAVGMMMIHNPWTVAKGDSAEMQSAAKMLDNVKETIINAYQQKTGLPRNEISRLMDEETWLPAQRAVELGFADKVIEASGKNSLRQRVLNYAAKAFRSAAEKKVSAKKFHRQLDLAKVFLEVRKNGTARTVSGNESAGRRNASVSERA